MHGGKAAQRLTGSFTAPRNFGAQQTPNPASALDQKKKEIDGSPSAQSESPATLLSAVTSLHVGLDLPSELFAVFTKHLSVPKAALLMPDESTAFLVPWVYRGIDRTTQHRLRLASEFLEALPGFQNGVTITIERENLGALESYFSRREYSLVQRLRILPFFDSERLVAALLVIDSESSPTKTVPDLGLVEAVASTIAAKINNARAFLGHGAIEMRDDALRSHLANVFGEAESAGLYVTVARIELAKLAERLMKDSTTADLYRFKRDLGAALTTMVSGSGEFVSLGERAALLIVQSRNPYSGRLLAHQFAEGVKGFLADSPFVPDFSDQTWRYPSGGYSVDEVIDAILE